MIALGYIIAGILIAIAVISASLWLASDTWHLCPNCRRWHCKLGALPRGKYPPAGAVVEYVQMRECGCKNHDR